MGVPQSRQKPRRATAELSNHDIVPRVTRKPDFGTGTITAKGPPTAFWHIRQWQTWTLSGAPSLA
jgi:hypothetical protein